MFLSAKLLFEKNYVSTSVSDLFMVASTSQADMGASNSTNNGCEVTRFKLPKVELKSFDGDVRNWIYSR